MTEPQPIVSTSALNDWVYRNADLVHQRSSDTPEKMSDPSFIQVKQSEDEPLSEQFKGFAWKGARKLVTMSGTSAGFVVGALGPVLLAEKLLTKLLEANEQGEALKHAYARDAMHLAVLNLVCVALPTAFVERARCELNASQRGATVILTRLFTSPEFEGNRAALKIHAQKGMQVARARGIVDSATLANARRDTAFDAQFRNDPAFRFGVQAQIFTASEGGG